MCCELTSTQKARQNILTSHPFRFAFHVEIYRGRSSESPKAIDENVRLSEFVKRFPAFARGVTFEQLVCPLVVRDLTRFGIELQILPSAFLNSPIDYRRSHGL